MLRSLWKLQWKQFAARMKKGNGKKTSGGWLVFLMLFLVVCMEILMFVGFAELVPLRNGAYMAVFRHGGHSGAGTFHAGQRFYDAGAVV